MTKTTRLLLAAVLVLVAIRVLDGLLSPALPLIATLFLLAFIGFSWGDGVYR